MQWRPKQNCFIEWKYAPISTHKLERRIVHNGGINSRAGKCWIYQCQRDSSFLDKALEMDTVMDVEWVGKHLTSSTSVSPLPLELVLLDPLLNFFLVPLGLVWMIIPIFPLIHG